MDNQHSLTRRDLFKKSAGGALAVAVLAAGMNAGGVTTLAHQAAQGSSFFEGGVPSAFAASSHGDIAHIVTPGTYTVTANIYVDKKDTPIHKNAYVTNPSEPPLHKPITPVKQNATLTITEDGKKLLHVPVVNNTLGVMHISDVSTDGVLHVQSRQTTKWSTFFYKGDKRISEIVFDITHVKDFSHAYTFTACVEFVKFALYRGEKHWDLHVTLGF